jgi:hypothetical protein
MPQVLGWSAVSGIARFAARYIRVEAPQALTEITPVEEAWARRTVNESARADRRGGCHADEGRLDI